MTDAAPPTLPIPVATVVRRRHRRRRTLLILLIVLLLIVVAAVVAVIVGDRIFRANAEAQIEQSVEQGLPEGVAGSVEARIGGGSALVQYLRGSFDEVDLTSQGLTVGGAPADAVVHLTGLPVQGGAVETATARLTVGQAAFADIPALREVGATAPKLGDDTVSTTLTRAVLGIDLKVAVVLKPSLSEQTVRLRATSATVTAGPATIPATAIVQQLLPDGVAVCAASYLPRGVSVTSVAVQPGKAVVGLAADDVDLTTLDTATTGSCD